MSVSATPEDRWAPRPLLAATLRITLLAVPFVVSGSATLTVAHALPVAVAHTWWGLTLLFVVALAVGVLVERLARRLLPLTVLLRMTMLFPDRAPSRLRVARLAMSPHAAGARVLTDAGTMPVADAVLSLIASLGAHDRRTRGHSERVRVLCDMLTAELHLDEPARDRVRWAALLHDLGKRVVPTTILNKPAKLDVAEFDVIKRHPAAGAQLASPLLPWLGDWGRGIAEHHEKYDGSGYPAGLSGREISEAGRLIAVVDAFETMTAARAYKAAVATRSARAELARCAGTHFDPGFVRAFLALSLPRVLWAMGPLAFFAQLPFLRSLAEAGVRTGNATGQAAASAASVATIATAGLAVAGVAVTAASPYGLASTSRPGADEAVVSASTAPSPSPVSGAAGRPGAADPLAPGARSAAPDASPGGASPVASPVAAPSSPTASPVSSGASSTGASSSGDGSSSGAATPRAVPTAERSPKGTKEKKQPAPKRKTPEQKPTPTPKPSPLPSASPSPAPLLPVLPLPVPLPTGLLPTMTPTP